MIAFSVDRDSVHWVAWLNIFQSHSSITSIYLCVSPFVKLKNVFKYMRPALENENCGL